MSTSFLLLASLCLLCATGALASVCPTTNVIQDPPIFQWTHHPVTGNNLEEYYSGTLEMGEVTLTIAGETLTTRAYRQAGTAYSIPGPTLVMEPGKKYVLRFHNTLPYEAPSPQHNVFKDPNVTNLHTHGLHLSGESPGDDVTRFFEGGFGGDFVYDIPSDHMGGTYWYHAHHHGSTFLQVSSGAFGLIIIDDSLDNIPPNVAAMTERHLIMAFLDPSVAGTGGDSLISGTLDPTWTANGTVAGNLCMPPDTWQHWRVLLADRDARTKTLTVGSGCEVALMARDGVWRTEVPKILTDNSIDLTGASRADLAVRCSADSDIVVANQLVTNIFVDGTPDASPNPYDEDGVSTWFSQRPSYLRDLSGLPVANTESVNMGARTINGEKFDVNVPTFTLPASGIEEWSLKGARNHPFHLHIYHVQIAESGCGEFEEGEYYDTVAQNCTIRFDLNPATAVVYDGRTIMHCHILEHEDQGAMGWADVLGGLPPPTFPADGDILLPYSEYYALGGGGQPPAAPGGLVASTVSHNAIDLSWVDNSSDEDNFEIEVSLDGSNFSFLALVDANVTSYSDTGLSPETIYYYQVRAVNSSGASGYSNIASATTDPAPQGTAVEVQSITVSTVNIGQGNKIGRAEVVVQDDLGNLVSGAIVSGDFTGTIEELGAVSDPTNASGLTVIDTTGSAKGKVSVTFCVTSITHPTLQDFAGEVCGSS
jgi:FtsP/CotA-like multicopper oxidase with cupredoxin domain